MGLNLVRDIKENRKGFCKCIYKKRKKSGGAVECRLAVE